MSTLHIANTDFEFELAQPNDGLSIPEIWEKYSLCLQLQFLPLLFADQQDALVVTHLPDEDFVSQFVRNSWNKDQKLPHFFQFTDEIPSHFQCLPWGASQRITKWLKEKKISTPLPAWETVLKINSKAFSYTYSKQLPQSALLSNSNDLTNWLRETKGIRVLKTCYGLSGRGHYFINDQTPEDEAIKFCQLEWGKNRPLIAEPWVNRSFDFSTQWYVHPNKIELIGPTVFETNDKGVYRSTKVGSEHFLFGSYHPFLIEHINFVQPILKIIQKEGFFGYLGIDAFLYLNDQNEIQLQPLVEINGRQTMSLAALLFQRKHFPKENLSLSLSVPSNSDQCLLPSFIYNKGKKISFSKNLIFHSHFSL